MDPLIWPTVLSLSFGGVIGIISQIQHSRCTEINCWGCFCKRKLQEEETEPIINLQENTEAITPQE
tara:strand:- start:536 stop:733 length:198 start_codon:yes stop_codon:yes gene_type:complete